jgi:hypothetical protein
MNLRVSGGLLFAVLALTACSGSHASAAPVTPSEANAVIVDWYLDGGFNKPHRCAAVRAAIERLPTSMVYSTIVEDARSLERRTCGG